MLSVWHTSVEPRRIKGVVAFVLTMSGRLSLESNYSKENKLQPPATEKSILMNIHTGNSVVSEKFYFSNFSLCNIFYVLYFYRCFNP